MTEKNPLTPHKILSNNADKKIRGNPAYQERQQQRRYQLEKKLALRRTFELGKLVEKAGLHNHDLSVVYALLLEAKEKRKENHRTSSIKQK